MKAKEYIDNFLNQDKDKSLDHRLVILLGNLILEVKEIGKARNAVLDRAYANIFKEQIQKSVTIFKTLNQLKYFKEIGTIKDDALMLYLKQQSPTLYYQISQYL